MKSLPGRQKSAKAIERSRSGRNGLDADEGKAVEQSSNIQPHSLRGHSLSRAFVGYKIE